MVITFGFVTGGKREPYGDEAASVSGDVAWRERGGAARAAGPRRPGRVRRPVSPARNRPWVIRRSAAVSSSSRSAPSRRSASGPSRASTTASAPAVSPWSRRARTSGRHSGRRCASSIACRQGSGVPLSAASSSSRRISAGSWSSATSTPSTRPMRCRAPRHSTRRGSARAGPWRAGRPADGPVRVPTATSGCSRSASISPLRAAAPGRAAPRSPRRAAPAPGDRASVRPPRCRTVRRAVRAGGHVQHQPPPGAEPHRDGARRPARRRAAAAPPRRPTGRPALPRRPDRRGHLIGGVVAGGRSRAGPFRSSPVLRASHRWRCRSRRNRRSGWGCGCGSTRAATRPTARG